MTIADDTSRTKIVLYKNIENLQPIGLDAQYTKLHDLVNQTVTTGISNSVLLTGAKGTGKTMVCLTD